MGRMDWRGSLRGRLSEFTSSEMNISGTKSDCFRPKMTHYPYLEITLSTHPLGLEKEPDTSCQYIVAARNRNRRGANDAKDGAEKEGGVDGNEVDVEMKDGETGPDTGVPITREAVGVVPQVSKAGQKVIRETEGKKRKSTGVEGVTGVKKKKANVAG